MPTVETDLIVCEHCDAVYHRHPLTHEQVARCGRCAAVLYRNSRLSIDNLLALTLAAAFTFVIANVSPVLRIHVAGLYNDATLWQSIMALSQGYATLMGVVAAATLFVIPLLQIALLGWVLGFAHFRHRAPGLAPIMVALHRLRPWSMTEVFLLALLVAIVKLADLLDVIVGPGTYATVALTVLITILAKRDVRSLWNQLPGAHT